MSMLHKSWVAPTLIVLSVALNIAFIGSWSVQVVGDQLRSGGHERLKEGVWCPLHRALQVSDEQWDALEPKLIALQQNLAQFCQEMEAHRREMIALIAASELDLDAIEVKKAEVRDHQATMQEMVVSHLLKEKAILTEEQEAKLFEMMLESSACAGPGRMFGFSGQGAGERWRETP